MSDRDCYIDTKKEKLGKNPPKFAKKTLFHFPSVCSVSYSFAAASATAFFRSCVGKDERKRRRGGDSREMDRH